MQRIAVEQILAAAAVRLRQRQPVEPHGDHLSLEARGSGTRPRGPTWPPRRALPVGEGAHRLLEAALLVAELEVHAHPLA